LLLKLIIVWLTADFEGFIVSFGGGAWDDTPAWLFIWLMLTALFLPLVPYSD